jgi:hypothetical protein
MASSEMSRAEFTAFLGQACRNLAAFSVASPMARAPSDWAGDVVRVTGRVAADSLGNTNCSGKVGALEQQVTGARQSPGDQEEKDDGIRYRRCQRAL